MELSEIIEREIQDPRSWNRTLMANAWDAYLGPARRGDVSPYAAPARADDLSGLPPAYLQVGALDVLRDENVEYAHRLLQAGVPTELHIYARTAHDFGVRHSDRPYAAWTQACARWLQDQGFLQGGKQP